MEYEYLNDHPRPASDSKGMFEFKWGELEQVPWRMFAALRDGA